MCMDLSDLSVQLGTGGPGGISPGAQAPTPSWTGAVVEGGDSLLAREPQFQLTLSHMLCVFGETITWGG